MAEETVLITGASSGIGLELAKLFAADGSNLVLVARRKDKLEELAAELANQFSIRACPISADLANPTTPNAIFEELARSEVQIDVLVNNAGFGAGGRFSELPMERLLHMVQVNVTTLTHLTRLFLPSMLQRGRGGILNVGSTAGFQPGPYLNVYYATKAYVLSFTEALGEEIAGTGVRATCLAPGATKTEFFAKADMENSLLVKFGLMDARAVARVGYRGFRAGKRIVVPGIINKLGAVSVRLVPRFFVRKITARLNRPA